MAKNGTFSLPELEQEAQRFFAPSTEKERAIVEAAVELVGAHGVAGATTIEIAKRARVTERTLFRYFPSKRDLVRRVLAPVMLRMILVREWLVSEWKEYEAVLEEKPGLKKWYSTPPAQQLAQSPKTQALARALLGEMTRDKDLREGLAKLWHRHYWRPMTQTLTSLRAKGAVRGDVDIETLAWAIDCLNIGYLFLRYVYAANRNWDDAQELGKMVEFLVRGSAAEPGPKAARAPARVAARAG